MAYPQVIKTELRLPPKLTGPRNTHLAMSLKKVTKEQGLV